MYKKMEKPVRKPMLIFLKQEIIFTKNYFLIKKSVEPERRAKAKHNYLIVVFYLIS